MKVIGGSQHVTKINAKPTTPEPMMKHFAIERAISLMC
jgi:hypothetical protein